MWGSIRHLFRTVKKTVLKTRVGEEKERYKNITFPFSLEPRILVDRRNDKDSIQRNLFSELKNLIRCQHFPLTTVKYSITLLISMINYETFLVDRIKNHKSESVR